MKRTTRQGMRRSWRSKLAAVLAGLTVVMTPLAAAPAYAEPVAIQVTISPNPAQARVGDGPTSITITLSNSDRQKQSEPVQAAVSVTGVESHADFTVNQGSCESVQGNAVNCGQLQPRGQTSFTVDITPRTDSDLAEGQTANGTISVSISSPNSGTGSGQVTIVGTNQNAPGIQGTVTDLDGEAIDGVTVAIKDSKGSTFEATTDGGGNYSINQPIAAGEVTVTFTKEGYEEKVETTAAQNGQMLTVNSRLEEVVEEEEEATEAAPEPEPETPATDDSSLSPLMVILIILGALLVLGGIVAIIMLIRKGKSDDDDDDAPLPDVPSTHKPQATQTGQLGVYDSSARPGMDAPTMIHNGPLVNDNDLARYGSEPASGFGPSYGEGGRDDSTRMYPTSGGPTSGGPYSGPTSGAGYGSQQAPGADSTRMYPTSGGPTSGQGWDRGGPSARDDRADGAWGRGYGERDTSPRPSSGGFGEPYGGAEAPRSSGGWAGGGQEAGWGSGAPQGDRSGAWSPGGGRDDYGRGGQDWQAQPGSHDGQQDWGRERNPDGYRGDDGRQSPPRHYGDNPYDDRPQSW